MRAETVQFGRSHPSSDGPCRGRSRLFAADGTDMDSRNLDQAFRTFLADASIDPNPSLEVGLSAMIEFYSTARADGCDPGADQDMLLFQWGTYDWGDGEWFEIELARQVMIPDEEDDDAIWQLHLTYRYPPSRELALLGSGNRWCPSPDETANFERFVLNAPPTAAAIALRRTRPEITFECAG